MNNVISQILAGLESRIGDRKFGMYFKTATHFDIDGSALRVTAESQFLADRIISHFRNVLQELAKKCIGNDATVEVRCEDKHQRNQKDAGCKNTTNVNHQNLEQQSTENIKASRPTAAPAGDRQPTRRKRPAARNSTLSRRHTFVSFVVGSSNELAYMSAMRMAEDVSDNAIRLLFLYSECGLGKTHLLQSTCQRFLELCPDAKVRYTTCEQFTNQYIMAIKNNRLESFRREMRSLNMLAIDDLHFLSKKKGTQSEFLHTLEAMANSGARIVMASDEHPRDINEIRQALISRFLQGMVAEIHRPERALRIQLIQKLAKQYRLNMNQSAAERLAAECIGSVREIEGTMLKLSAIRDLDAVADPNAEIGHVMVDRIFRNTSAAVNRPVKISEILTTVCERLAVDPKDLLSTTRHHRVVLARGLLVYFAREMTTLSYPDISTTLGRRHHSTAITAHGRIDRWLKDNKPVEVSNESDSPVLPIVELVDQLRQQIRTVARPII